jgi:hypothetical protein
MYPKTLFMANFTDGYSLRNTICMIKNEADEITLLISSSNIMITFKNKGNYGIHDIFIKKEELLEYSYNIKDYQEYPLTINATEWFNATKSVARKDGLKIYWMEGQDKLSIQTVKWSKEPGRANVAYINIIHKEFQKIDFFNQYSEGSEPTIKIQNREFTEICTQASTLKCHYLEISGCNRYIQFKGILPDGTEGMSNRLANHAQEDGVPGPKVNIGKGHVELNVVNHDDVIVIKIPSTTIKTLSKLHTISPVGTLLKFSFAPKKPMKIESKIGSYGIYNIYLRDYKPSK